MAAIQNGYNYSPPQSDDEIPISIKNGNKESPPELANVVVKIVVIGEPRCGKTRFIRQYYDNHVPGFIYSYNGVRVYPCEFSDLDLHWIVSIFEIPGNPGFFPAQRIPHYEQANIIIFMYAIDDPKSLQMLTERWIVEAINIIELYNLPVMFLGNKKDLQDDPQVIQSLALEYRSPVTYEQGSEMLDQFSGNASFMECSATDLELVELVFNAIFGIYLIAE